MLNNNEQRFDTPVLFLIFNRPETTQQVFAQIKQLQPSQLFVAADGWRTDIPREMERCLETRKIIDQVDWNCTVKTHFNDTNLGCGKAVSSAIGWFFDQVEEGIILEDDCVPNQSFFDFCANLLAYYRGDKQIMMIGGSNFQNSQFRGIGSYYFSNYDHVWGWATWRRAWQRYDFEMGDLEEVVTKGVLDPVFQTRREQRFWLTVFRRVKQKKIDTWDFQWKYTIWKHGGMVITPNWHLVVNISGETTSTHHPLNDSQRDQPHTHAIELPLVHPTKSIDRIADRYTFQNVMGTHPRRILRLLRENGWSIVIRHSFRKYLKDRLLGISRT